MTTHTQMIHCDMNYCDAPDESGREMRLKNSRDNALVIAEQINAPHRGVHAQAVETVCGWAVEVVTNSVTCGMATLKSHCIAAGMLWHNNAVTEHYARELLLTDGWSCDDVDAMLAKCSGQQARTQITDPRWKGV